MSALHLTPLNEFEVNLEVEQKSKWDKNVWLNLLLVMVIDH